MTTSSEHFAASGTHCSTIDGFGILLSNFLQFIFAGARVFKAPF